jgi:hypothetical protein
MRKPEKTTLLLILFTILTLVSLLTVYAVHQTPTEETKTRIMCQYASAATYDYTAILAPNTIYDNKTTLKPNEGALYAAITKQINITLNYTFTSTLPADATITYSLAQILKTTAWPHLISSTAQTTTNETRIQIELTPVNKTELETTKKAIETDTGTSSTTYTLEITPTFTVNATTTAGSISQTFQPTLTIDFQRTDQGDTIKIGNLQQADPGALTESQTITRQDVLNQRYASYILITLSVAGAFFSAYFYRKTKPTHEKPPLEKIMAPYKDLIIEAQEPPKTTPETTIINVTTIKQLARTAEILARPMILTRKPQPTLTIIDQNTLYQHQP